MDVDDLQCAITRNGDYAVIYADERLGGATATNAHNVAWLTGGKYPRLRYQASTLTLDMDRIDPAQARPGVMAFLMLSAGTAGIDAAAWLNVAGAGTGFFPGLSNDLFWALMWQNAPAFLVALGGTGTAQWPGIPNVTALVGLPIHLAGGTLDFQAVATGPLLSFTDTILQ